MATRLLWSSPRFKQSMNLRLLAIVFLATAVGIGAGWFSGRASLDRQIEALLHGNSSYIHAMDRTMAARAMSDETGEAVIEALKRGQVMAVFNLYRYSNDVDLYLSYKNLDKTATGMAKELLKQMDCDSLDAYFERFERVYIYGASNYQNAGTKENEAFRLFIESIISEQNQIGAETNAG